MTDKQKTLAIVVEELAKEIDGQCRMGSMNGESFKEGFFAGVAEMKKRAQGLVIELECALKYLEPTYKNSEKHEPEVCMIECFKKALEAYRKAIE